MKLIDLGWCMGRLKIRDKTSGDSLIISSASNTDANVYQPAESVTIYGLAGLLALRDALNEAYPAEEKKETPRTG